jgi:hypothetical protein
LFSSGLVRSVRSRSMSFRLDAGENIFNSVLRDEGASCSLKQSCVGIGAEWREDSLPQRFYYYLFGFILSYFGFMLKI